MKHLFLILTLFCALALQAAPIQPIIMDNPDVDLNSELLTDEQRSFFEPYINAIQQMEQGADAEQFFTIHRVNEEVDEVEPLLGGIVFNQDAPYNNMCPKLNSNQRSVTGCVATAMAQVMRYYQYPACGTGDVTYSGGSNGAVTLHLEDHPFDWSNILEDYNGTYTDAQANAVANLMLMCGASLGMNYSKDGSSAQTEKVRDVMQKNFGYDKSIRFIDNTTSGNPEETVQYWGLDVVIPELKAGHPLIFAGFPAMGKTGHCFVIDGYRVEDDVFYFHVNWGWGGYGNCYCLLTNLSYGNEYYSGYNVQMVYYIKPATTPIDNVETENPQVSKFIQDGHLLIRSNDRIYTTLGQQL